jgi:hypothetical protein
MDAGGVSTGSRGAGDEAKRDARDREGVGVAVDDDGVGGQEEVERRVELRVVLREEPLLGVVEQRRVRVEARVRDDPLCDQLRERAVAHCRVQAGLGHRGWFGADKLFMVLERWEKGVGVENIQCGVATMITS